MKIWMILVVMIVLLIPFMLKADLTKKILFSNKGYAKEIEVKTYILTQQQMGDLFNHPYIEPKQLSVKELNNINYRNYFVVRIKNLGKRHAWGVLSCKVRCIHEPFEIPIISITKDFCDNVICITGIAVAPAENSIYPSMFYEWSELYTQ